MAEVFDRQQEHSRRHHRPGAPDRVVGDADLGTVGHRHDDPFAWSDAELDQSAGHAAGAVEQLPRVMPAPFEQQRRVVATPAIGLLGQAGQVVLGGLIRHVRNILGPRKGEKIDCPGFTEGP